MYVFSITDRLLVLVGAGSAGAVLATRLSEDPGTSVLVLEAGGTGEDNWFINTPLLLALVQRSNVDWNYLTEPQKHAAFGMKEQVNNGGSNE